MLNIPTALTWLRIVLIPVFVGVYYAPDAWLSQVARDWIGMGVFALAAITDWLDGYLARRWGQTSAFGAFLDPVADKLMVAAALILLVWLKRADAYLAIIIIGREIAISALREWMAQLGRSRNVAVALVGKVKTVAQMTALIALLLWENVIPGVSTPLLGTIALWVAATLTLWSMFHYLKLAAPHFRGEPSPRDSETPARRAAAQADPARPPLQ
ncbi:MAG: CDP-diacylglycerol--glycerol-3-phosphate 3-phosphatidyltransferase [Betaproteobacteria bacterium]|nr:CDP-diacylglycerol--glycerol-3-phosphate 3-phosphatidyltransferase [Betaproteobacteria bacterium]MDE2003737.1 CDP-diacylglycerol--glycerol-3-phosphate 3-phosphatidyltransferase [Betaproteobacteria bacterium]MDE2210818.1 CDP-diacylglycerol--glycerol-3-phosphate 3-phosphatidyltransferase [Betaproteobacteria bacterium]MDE2360473.1 CDP-diacylglycerol--glycerol-3-phosphate 3-phosphatidyltransferase [Betaproteobacteria bacterium]